MTGHILNGRLWPILLDSSPDPLVQKRTLAFMESLASDWSIFQTLTEQEVLFLLVGVRDLWLADSRGLLNTNEKSTLNTVLDQLEDDLVPSAEHQSLNFSFCPTKNRRVFKLISHLEEKSEIDSVLLQSVAQMKIKMDDGEEIDEFLYAVWVDPRDLSYHNFEFILPLDRALKRKSNGENDTLDFKMTGVKSLAKKMRILSGNLSGADTDLLLQLDKLGLYQKPANSSTRGGERFVFSSSALAHGLTRAIKQSDVLDKLSMKMKFQFVNYIFRCNKFSPSDAKFDMHLDTPYYDKTRRHISAHTMIIYLSSGSGESILKVLDNGKKNRKEISVNKVGALEFIIFNQQYEHEGRPFIDNDKIFLRTELIFEYEPKTLVHKPEVSKIFSSAIYMTLESAFQPALSKYAHQLYEKVNAVHWGLEQESDPPKVLHKCWAEQIHFASNGSDYWFPFTQPKSDSKPSNKNPLSSPEGFIKIAAIIAVLDYLNANVKQNTENDREGKKRKRKKKTPSEPLVFETFRSNCQVLEISPPPNDSSSARNTSDWILKHLWSSIGDMIIGSGAENYSVLPMGSNPKQIFEAELSDYVNPLKADDSGEENEEKSDSESYCCPFHNYDRDFEASTNITVYERYEEIVEYGIGLLYESLLFIYDKKIYLDEDSITIDGDKIFVGTSELLPVVNFACKYRRAIVI